VPFKCQNTSAASKFLVTVVTELSYVPTQMECKPRCIVMKGSNGAHYTKSWHLKYSVDKCLELVCTFLRLLQCSWPVIFIKNSWIKYFDPLARGRERQYGSLVGGLYSARWGMGMRRSFWSWYNPMYTPTSCRNGEPHFVLSMAVSTPLIENTSLFCGTYSIIAEATWT
jgi:hypothetical protein